MMQWTVSPTYVFPDQLIVRTRMVSGGSLPAHPATSHSRKLLIANVDVFVCGLVGE